MLQSQLQILTGVGGLTTCATINGGGSVESGAAPSLVGV